MAACAPLRFLAGNRNLVREATLTPSSVLPVANSVLSVPTARDGTAQVDLSGNYSGFEAATYDVEVLDDDVETPIVSARVFEGEGSGTLDDVDAVTPEDVTVELSESGLPILTAKVDFEGATVVARTPGAAGNSIFFRVDQSALVFTGQAYSLLADLAAGAGATDSPMVGPEFDFDTKTLGADNAIPLDAHRISFGDDPTVYLQYKVYADNAYQYFLVPALKRDVPKGTVVNFVTGSRTVYVGPGSPLETHAGIVTLYDLLNSLKTTSALVDVETIVANDRSPTGQAAHELQTRTDAYAPPTSGDGSEFATGFADVTVDDAAGTQLITATCRAVSPTDHPLASVGRERWELKSSILGDLGVIVTGEPFSGAQFGLTIPRRLPFAIDEQVGNFTVTDIQYDTTDPDRVDPPICPAVGERAGRLGPAAVNQTLTLVYTKRPDGDCACVGMPEANLETPCLGNDVSEGDASMAYQEDTRARIQLLREWFVVVVRANSALGGPSDLYASQEPFISTPVSAGTTVSGILRSLKDVVDQFESTLALIDPLEQGSPTPRGNGCLAWDDAFSELQGDVATFTVTNNLQSIPTDRYAARLGAVLITAGISPLGGADASTVTSGDGCWQDFGGDYWTVVGSDKGAYAPAFTNHAYFSSRRADNTASYFSTHEFAFHIRVKETCVADLRYGDTITMQINSAARPSTYQVGDVLSQTIIGASDLSLAGGRDSSLVQAWYVTGSVSGAFAPYTFDPDAPAYYSTITPAALSFVLTPGGIPFAKGDRFRFTIEGGHYQWRKNGGAWNVTSPPEPIPAGAVALDAGLFVAFTPGAAPSFAAGDRFSFLALQPWAASNIQTPGVEAWRWDGTAATLVIDSGSAVPSDALAIGLHTLPEGTTITIEGGDAAGVYLWSESVTWRAGVIAHLHTATRTNRYRRLSVSNAAAGRIGWLWCGMAFGASGPADVTPHRSYKFAAGDGSGLNPGRRYLGKGRGADVEWQEAALSDDDMAELADMLDWIKEHDDEPLVFLSQVTRPEEAMLVQVVDDEIIEEDLGKGNRASTVARKFRVRLSLGAFLQ